MRTLVIAAALASLPFRLSAQAPAAQPVVATTTAPSQKVSAGLSRYNYVEPGKFRISIHGAKFASEYTGTFSLNAQRHWFARTNVRVNSGSTSYDGLCAPWLIVPSSASPNGYRLSNGDYSACTDEGNLDWYLEGRGLVGKDFVGHTWTWSPEAGVAVRHLSNRLANIADYRTDNYLYLPVGLTARTAIAARHLLSLNVEYDHMTRGWQKTLDSQLGGGSVRATATAPAFTINSFTDISFDQHRGWALRASATYQMSRRWSVEPYWIHWRVEDSTVNYETVTFTVNGIAAQQQRGAYEPLNTTDEAGVKLHLRIR